MLLVVLVEVVDAQVGAFSGLASQVIGDAQDGVTDGPAGGHHLSMDLLSPPRLSFACELDAPRLSELFANRAVIADLQALGAHVALMLSDLTDERAAVVRRLNSEGIPIVGIPLVPLEDGYYFTIDNAERAEASYQEWKAWTAQHGLQWEGVGLDIEPDAHFYLQIMSNPWGLLPMLLPRLFDARRPRRAKAAYTALVARIHGDGYRVENYQFPLIEDERWARSSLLQRLMGLVDLKTDREVWMLYTSVLPVIGPGLLWTYAAEAEAVGVGSTGGGPDIPGHPRVPTLDWEGFSRDLRLARHHCDNLLIHSLEGCVEQRFLNRLRTFDWELPEAPPKSAATAAVLRAVLRGILWASAHPWPLLAVTITMMWRLSRQQQH
jgi:hypothetical protein